MQNKFKFDIQEHIFKNSDRWSKELKVFSNLGYLLTPWYHLATIKITKANNDYALFISDNYKSQSMDKAELEFLFNKINEIEATLNKTYLQG